MFYINKKIVLGFVVLLVTFFIVDRVFFFEKKGRLEDVASTIMYPAIWSANQISDYVQHKIKRKDSHQKLKLKYKKLKEEYLNTLDEIVRLNTACKYYSMSQELRDFQQRYNLENMLLCKILVKIFSSNGHYFIINRGTENGVRKNMAAVYKFQLLGKVTEVYPHFSKVILITDQNCKVASFTNSTEARGIVTGQNDLRRCKMNYVSHLLDVIDEDLVFSSGQGLVFPEGFCLGKIVKHEHAHNMLYHEIEIEPIIKLKKLKFCLLTDQTKINLF
jgi:rod shape-determining protein MreC